MGNGSEKRIAKEAAIYTQYYSIALGFVNLFYFIVGIWYNWDDVSIATLFSIGFFSLVSYFCYAQIIVALNNGVELGWYNDLFLVNLTTQLLTAFSGSFWLVYLTIPGYILYNYGGFLKGMNLNADFLKKGFIFGHSPAELATETENEKKKRVKKERHESRQKFKIMH